MKKIFAVIVAILFVASLSLLVVGCKKAEEKAQTSKAVAPAQKMAPAIKVPSASKDASAIKNPPAPEAAHPDNKSKQQQFRSCFDEAKAKALKGEERSKFMTDCIRAIK